MDEFIKLMQERLPEIATVAISAVCYILYFVIKAKVGKSGRNLHTLVKEKVKYVDGENMQVKKHVQDEINKMQIEFNKVREDFDILEKKVLKLEKRQEKSEKVLVTMIEEDAVNE